MSYLIVWDIRASECTLEEKRDHDTFLEALRAESILQGHALSENPQALPYTVSCDSIEAAGEIARRDPFAATDKATFTVLPWVFESASDGSSDDPPSRRFDPIFPTTDMQRSLEHYRLLGFQMEQYNDEYAFVTWQDVGCIHLTLQSPSEYDPKIAAAAAYFHVEDADALAERWRRDCPEGDTREVVATDYGLREGAHLDPDNNLIRFGSPMAG